MLTSLSPALPLGSAPQITVELSSYGSASDPAGGPWFGLVQGQTHDFVVQSQAGDPTVVLASTGAPSGLSFEGQPLLIDLATAFVVGAAIADVRGRARVAATIPAGLAVGTPLFTQAAAIDGTTFTSALSNGLEHAVTDLALTVVAEGDKTSHPAGWQPPSTLVLEDDPAWQSFWTLHNPFQPAQQVDFSRNVVFASFAGLVGQSVRSLAVDQLVPLGGGVRVETTLTDPGLGCGGSFSMRFPC